MTKFVLLTVAVTALFSGLLMAVSQPAQTYALDKQDYCDANPYGIDGELSQQDLNDLFYIAFPQTTVDMRGRFGSPMCWDAASDYYRVEGTTHYVAVDFGSDGLAIGWRAWEVNQ